MPFRPERTELFPIKTKNVPHYVIQAFSASGVEESTTLEKKPTQDQTGHLGRFLDSLCSLGMTCRGVPFNPTGCIRDVDGGRLPPLHCVVPFNRTGDHCNVDGGRLPPLHCVVSFNRTGYHCNVAGGRLPPLRQCTTFFLFYRHKTRIDSSKMCCFATNAIRPCLYPIRSITSVRLSHRAVARVRSS